MSGINYQGTPLTEGTYTLPSMDDEAHTFDMTVAVIQPPATISVNPRPVGAHGRVMFAGVQVTSYQDFQSPDGETPALSVVDIPAGYMFDHWDIVESDGGDAEEYQSSSNPLSDYPVSNTLEYIFTPYVSEVTATGGVAYSGTPETPGTYTLMCQDDSNNPLVLTVLVKERPVPESTNRLERYDSEGISDVFYLPNIQSIEETDNVQLTEISTIVYGFDYNFVMDLGTTQRYTVNFIRVQPRTVNDTGDDPEQWSNGRWFAKLKEFLDGWQNLNYGTVDAGEHIVRTGGFRLVVDPITERLRTGDQADYSMLYPPIDRTGFIAGNISMTQSGSNLQYLKVTIPFAVGSMIRQVQTEGGHQVTLRAGINNISDPTVPATRTVAFPSDFDYPAPSAPSAWVNYASSYIFKDWYVTNSSATHYSMNSIVPYAVSDLTANWLMPRWITSKTTPGDSDPYLMSDILSSIGTTYTTYMVKVWLVGGGGAGQFVYQGVGRTTGGGGSGGFIEEAFALPVDRVTSLKVHVGYGGSASHRNGEDTTFSIEWAEEGTELMVTAGGGGKGIDSGGAAGQPGGGRGGTSYTNENGRTVGGTGGAVPALDSTLRLYNPNGADIILHSVGAVDYGGAQQSRPEMGGGGCGKVSNNNNCAGADGVAVIAVYGW